MEAAGDASADVAADAADSATSDVTPTDASVVDASTDASDGGGDECATYCGPITPDASCPGFVCDIVECSLEAGCEPFV